jgi:hypothetical protein
MVDERNPNQEPEQDREDFAEQKDLQQADEKKAKQNNGKPHANQYTSGRNDDRGRKE